MFDRLMQGALAKVANSDMAEARLTLVKLKILAEAPNVAFAYVDGVRKVAGLLSQRFGLWSGTWCWGEALTQRSWMTHQKI